MRGQKPTTTNYYNAAPGPPERSPFPRTFFGGNFNFVERLLTNLQVVTLKRVTLKSFIELHGWSDSLDERSWKMTRDVL